MSLPTYKIFRSAEFVERSKELELVQTILEKRSKDVIILEGDRGSGKTSLLFEIYRHLDERTALRPFLVCLFPHSAPEFKSKRNNWIDSAIKFQKECIPSLLSRIARYWGIDPNKSKELDIGKEYLNYGPGYNDSEITRVLLIDSIYECQEMVRIEIERYLLSPILGSEHVLILLSGRGKRPIWSRPELQIAEMIHIPPLTEEYVKEQLVKMGSPHKSEYREIADLSGGYPLTIHIMGKSRRDLFDGLNDAIDIMIKDTLRADEQKSERYQELRVQIEKLSLVNIPFRTGDVEDYLYPNDTERRTKTSDLFALMLTSRILKYDGKGYQINQSIIHPIRKWLMLKQPSTYQRHLNELISVSNKLQERYPSARMWYQRMIPIKTIMAHE